MADSSRWWLPVAIALTLVGWGANQFASMLVFYREDYGFSQLEVTSMLGIYVAGLIPALLFGGRISDRIGRKSTTVVALLVTVAASSAMMFGALWALPIYLGRLLAGVATGAAMAAGTSWIKELSPATSNPAVSNGSGARRASLFTTAGFCLGPIASGMIANFAPLPATLPYLVHIVLCLPVLLFLLRVPGTKPEALAGNNAEARIQQYAYEGAQRRFRRVIVPSAPWVFGAGTIGFAVVPNLFANLGEQALIYSTVAVALTLGSGVAVQPIARRLDSTRSARAILVALGLSVAGLLLALICGLFQTPWLALLACCCLGGGYGLMMVAGLLETQRLSTPQRLGTATGKFYMLAYAGFLAPTLLAYLGQWFGLMELLITVTVLALLCLVVIALNSKRHLLPLAGHPTEVAQTGTAQKQ